MHGHHAAVDWTITLLFFSKKSSKQFLFCFHRVVAPGSSKSMGPHSFVNWGAHCDDYPTPYFTVAAAIGISYTYSNSRKIIAVFFRWVVHEFCVISLYKPTTTLQSKVLGFVWCTQSHLLFPKALDNQPKKIHISYTYCIDREMVLVMHVMHKIYCNNRKIVLQYLYSEFQVGCHEE